jgi:hypothetical protein
MPDLFRSGGNHRLRLAQATRLCALAVSLTAVAACAPSSGTSGSPDLAAAQSPVAQSPAPVAAAAAGAAPKNGAAASTGDTDLECTKATKTKIVQTTADTGTTYSFSRRRLTIQRGAFLAITNTSDRAHALVSTPDAGIVTSVLDLQERQVIQFPKEGRFTVRSASAAHRAVLRVIVTGESGCGAVAPKLTITDGYAFSPGKFIVAATANFAVVNRSGTAQTVRCTPDPGGNGDNSRLDKGETQLLAIDQPGRYICGSVEHPEAKVIIKVKKA